MKIVSKSAALMLLLATAACDESPVSLPEPASVAVSGATMSLLVGEAAPVAAQVLDQGGQVMPGLTPVFSTDNPSVATVGNDGMVRGVGPGTASVSATYGGSSAVVQVTVAAASVTVSVARSEMALVVGDAAPVAAQVLDRNGRVIQDARLVFSTDNPTVATVNADGTVRAVSPGTANVSAAYGGVSATVVVTVAADRRGDLQSLDLLADSVVADRRAGVQVVALHALNGYGQRVCPQLVLHSSDRTVAVPRMGGTCRIEIVPGIAGRTTITATAGGHTDSVRVRVTSTGAISFFSAQPTAAELVAGATVRYTVKVLDQNNQPVAGQRVNFEVSVGSVSPGSVLTGADGTASVEWQIPTDLRNWGQTQWIAYRTVMPSGLATGRDHHVFINGASLEQIVLYGATGWMNTGGLQRLGDPATITTSRYSGVTLGARGIDAYGNVRIEDFTFTITGPAAFDFACSSQGRWLASGIKYTCIEGVGSPGTATVQVQGGSGQQKSISVVFY